MGYSFFTLHTDPNHQCFVGCRIPNTIAGCTQIRSTTNNRNTNQNHQPSALLLYPQIRITTTIAGYTRRWRWCNRAIVAGHRLQQRRLSSSRHRPSQRSSRIILSQCRSSVVVSHQRLKIERERERMSMERIFLGFEINGMGCKLVLINFLLTIIITI